LPDLTSLDLVFTVHKQVLHIRVHVFFYPLNAFLSSHSWLSRFAAELTLDKCLVVGVDGVFGKFLFVDGAKVCLFGGLESGLGFGTVHALLLLVALFAVHIVVIVNRQVIHEIGKWHHHCARQGPPEASRAREVVKALEHLLSRSWEHFCVLHEHWFNLKPLCFKLRSVQLSLHLQLLIHELADLMIGPIGDNV